jgi:hypothetical protein
MNRLSLLAPLALLLSCIASNGLSQSDGPYWSSYPIPAGVTRFSALGTTGVVETPTATHFYSGIHRTWNVQAVNAPVVFGPTNSYVLVQDGSLIHGFSSRSGQVSTLSTSGSATVNIGTVSSSWTAYVMDGNTVYGWSGFYGQWVPLVLQGPLQGVGIGSHVIQVADSQNVYAFSAFFGTWVAEPTRAGANYLTFRNGAVVTYSAPTEVKAFSVYQNSWQSISYPSAQAAVFDSRDGYATLSAGGGTDMVWFSALTGRLVRRQSPNPVSVTFGPNCAVLQSAGAVTGYSPATDAFVALPAIGTGSLLLAQGSFGCYALIDDGISLTAFNGLTSRVTPAPNYVPFLAYTLGDTAAFAAGPLEMAFSALRDQWYLAPTAPSVTVMPMFEGIVRSVSGGYEAFSARTGTFSMLSTGSGALVTQAQGALTAFVTTAGGIDAFDHRGGQRWRERLRLLSVY